VVERREGLLAAIGGVVGVQPGAQVGVELAVCGADEGDRRADGRQRDAHGNKQQGEESGRGEVTHVRQQETSSHGHPLIGMLRALDALPLRPGARLSARTR
jgi:hypothetical protein